MGCRWARLAWRRDVCPLPPPTPDLRTPRPPRRPRGPRAQPQGHLRRPAPRRPHRLHRAVRARASPPSRSTRSSPRASGATSSRCPPTPGSSSARWTSPTSTSSRASRPAVSIDQKSTNRNPRSTVGTITEVYDYLRLLFARAGRPHCPVCGEPITRQSPQQIVDRLLELPDRTRFQVLAPVVRARKGEYVDLFTELQSKGFSRARVDGEVISPDRAAEAGEAGQAHHRRRRRPARGQGRATPAPSVGSPTRSRPLSGSPAASSSSSSSTGRRTTPSGSAASPSGWPAPTTTRSPWTRSSRAPSRSTVPSAPVPRARASAPSSRSTPSSSSPTRTSRCPRGPSRPGGAAAARPTTSSG